MAAPRTLSQKVWDDHVVHASRRRARPALHRPPPRPRGHQPQAFDGLRLAGRTVRRPDLTVATEDHNVPTDRHPPADRRPDLAPSRSRCCGRTAPSSASRLLPDGRPRPGHRARDRPRAGPDPAGHDHRLRRQPHLDPRRVRGAGLRHRHQRGRARARHPDPAPATGPARWPSPSTATCPPASPPRTSSSPSSAASAPAAASATSSSTAARPSGRCRWRAA